MRLLAPPHKLSRWLIPAILVVIGITISRKSLADNKTPSPTLNHQATVILRENCFSCHNPEKRKGGLVLTSRESALVGGEDGAALSPGKSGASKMASVLSADADGHMPPKAQLSQTQIATIRDWIDAGAVWDGAAAKVAGPSTAPIVLGKLSSAYHPVLCMALAPDQKRLAVGRGNRVLLYDLTTDTRPLIGEIAATGDVVQSLAWSSDGHWLAAGAFRTIRIWEAKAGAPISKSPICEIGKLAGRVTAMTFLPDQPVLVAADGDASSPATLRTWQIPSGEVQASWPAHADSILSIKVSKDGKLLVTAGADKVAKAWALPGGKEIAKFEGHAGPVMAVALSADAAQLATAGSDKEIKIWNVKTRDQTASLTTNPSAVIDLAWTTDGKVISAAEDGLVRLSSEANKTRADRSFTGAPDVLYCVCIAAGGKTIFAGCHDGNVYVWDTATASAKGTLALTATSKPATPPTAKVK